MNMVIKIRRKPLLAADHLSALLCPLHQTFCAAQRDCMHWLLLCASVSTTNSKTMPRIRETDSPRHNKLWTIAQ